MKVYAVCRLSCDEYGDYDLVKIFDSIEKAQAYVDKRIEIDYEGERGCDAWFLDEDDDLLPYFEIREMIVE